MNPLDQIRSEVQQSLATQHAQIDAQAEELVKGRANEGIAALDNEMRDLGSQIDQKKDQKRQLEEFLQSITPQPSEEHLQG